MRPMIAIVGRPNVGKSTLLNRLAGRRVAVVDDLPGVTRDRLFVDCRIGAWDVVLVDTGGLDVAPEDDIVKGAVEKAHLAVEEADLILFLVDGRDGVHPMDHQVATVLRKSGKPFVCLVNKVDPGSNRDAVEFHELGLGFLTLSAAHGSGLSDLAEAIDPMLIQAGFERPVDEESDGDERQGADREDDPTDEPADEAGEQSSEPTGPLKFCLLGRPNVGKSSLANRLVGQRRQIVSEVAGTTRDAVDIPLEHGDQAFLMVDTPGVRRRVRISENVERYSVVAALRSLGRADVAVVVIDAGEPFSDQDARLLSLAQDRGRSIVVAVNKCDLWKGDDRKTFLKDLTYSMRFAAYVPVLPVSALTGRGIERLLPEVCTVRQAAGVRLGTGDLNRLVEDAVERQQPPVIKGRRGKIFYATQTGVYPPIFIFWVNDPKRFSVAYRRFLDHRLRARFAFPGTPLRLHFRSRKQSGKRGKSKRGKKR
jgi:GTP-binding protein